MIDQGYTITAVSAGVSITLTPRHTLTHQAVTTTVVNTALAGTGRWIVGQSVQVRMV